MTKWASPLHILLQDLEDLCLQIREVGVSSDSNLLSTRCEGEGHGHWFGNEIISHQLPGKTPFCLFSPAITTPDALSHLVQLQR